MTAITSRRSRRTTESTSQTAVTSTHAPKMTSVTRSAFEDSTTTTSTCSPGPSTICPTGRVSGPMMSWCVVTGVHANAVQPMITRPHATAMIVQAVADAGWASTSSAAGEGRNTRGTLRCGGPGRERQEPPRPGCGGESAADRTLLEVQVAAVGCAAVARPGEERALPDPLALPHVDAAGVPDHQVPALLGVPEEQRVLAVRRPEAVVGDDPEGLRGVEPGAARHRDVDPVVEAAAAAAAGVGGVVRRAGAAERDHDPVRAAEPRGLVAGPVGGVEVPARVGVRRGRQRPDEHDPEQQGQQAHAVTVTRTGQAPGCAARTARSPRDRSSRPS